MGWLAHRRQRRNCLHHEPGPRRTVSFIESRLIDLGRRKMLWCTRCQQVWIV